MARVIRVFVAALCVVVGAPALTSFADVPLSQLTAVAYNKAEPSSRAVSSRHPVRNAPGTLSDRTSGSEVELRKLDKELTRTGSLRAASALLLAKERYRKGS